MKAFQGARDTKEFLVAKIVSEAERQGVPLSEVERKMLYFSETARTLPDMSEVYDRFSSEYDQDEYEAKITGLIKQAYRRVSRESKNEYEAWWSAVRALSKQDYYILVMVRQAALRARGDRLKLLGTGTLLAGLMLALSFLFHHFGIERYSPSGEVVTFYAWVAALGFAAAWLVFQMVIRTKKGDQLVSRFVRNLGRTSRHTK